MQIPCLSSPIPTTLGAIRHPLASRSNPGRGRSWLGSRSVALLGLTLLNAGWNHSIASAQDGTRPRWTDWIEPSQSSLTPTSLPDPSPSRKKLEVAFTNLERFLATSPTHGPRWRSVLQLDTVQNELASPTPNLEVLNDVEKRFRQNFSGLEMQEFRSVRDSLENFVQTQRVAANPETTMQILRNRLGRLAERAQTPESFRDVGGMHELAQTVAYLHSSNQAPELVTSLRSQYANPNVRVLLGRDFVEHRLARPVDEQNPVNELILGTTVRGQSQLTGTVSPKLLDSPSRAALRLQLSADFSSLGRGFNRSVVLNTQSSANVTAAESIALSESGLISLGDTLADADLRTRINSIEHNLRIVRKIAAKQAAKQKPLADSISRSRLENRLRRQFHEQLSTQLSSVNGRLDSAGQPELMRLGISKPSRSSWSSPDCMAVLWNVRSGVQLASAGSCPLPAELTGINIQIHQSAVGNLLDPVLAGRVLRSQDMDSYIAQFGEAAKRIPRRQEDGPWSITMNGFQPVEILLDDSLIRIRIRTTKLDREDQSLTQPATIDAAYRVEIADGAIQLHRVGDVNVEFSGKQQTGVRSVTLRTFLKNKFEQLFREQLLDTPLVWSDRLPEQFRDLRLASLAIDDGWMQLHLK